MTPTIRFPDFQGQLPEHQLADIATFRKGKGVSKADIVEAGHTACVRYGELYTTYGQVIDEPVSKTNLPATELLFSQANDVVIPASGETSLDIATAACVLRDGIALGGDLNIIRGTTNGLFLAYYLSNKKKPAIARLGQGNSVVHLYGSHLAGLKLRIPSAPEQQKIADFLVAVDERIKLLQRRGDAIQRYKQGMMQRIFSQSIRFKRDDGSAFPEWSDTTLGDVAFVDMGQSPDSSSYNDNETGVPLIQGNADIRNRVSAPRRFTSSPIKLSEVGDILLSVRAPVGEVSKAIHVACIGRGMAGIRKRQDNDQEFIFQYLLNYEPQWISLGQGSTFTAISGPDIRKLGVRVPHPDEQSRIAAFLSALDDKIATVFAQVDHMHAFKKGLLQQMFV